MLFFKHVMYINVMNLVYDFMLLVNYILNINFNLLVFIFNNNLVIYSIYFEAFNMLIVLFCYVDNYLFNDFI